MTTPFPPPADPSDEPGRPPPGQPQYGQPQYGQPPYGQPQYGQPQYGQPPYGQASGKPDSYLVWAILSTVLCCLPLGIVSILAASKVDSAWAMGDYAGAQAASERARRFAVWSAAACGILLVVYVLFAVVLGAVGFVGA